MPQQQQLSLRTCTHPANGRLAGCPHSLRYRGGGSELESSTNAGVLSIIGRRRRCLRRCPRCAVRRCPAPCRAGLPAPACTPPRRPGGSCGKQAAAGTSGHVTSRGVRWPARVSQAYFHLSCPAAMVTTTCGILRQTGGYERTLRQNALPGRSVYRKLCVATLVLWRWPQRLCDNNDV